MMNDDTDTATLDRGDDFDPAATEAAAALEAGKGAPTETATAAALEAELAQKAATETAEAAAALEEEANKTKNKDTRIPLSRHEAVLGKEREKSAELKRQLQPCDLGLRRCLVGTCGGDTASIPVEERNANAR